MMPNFARTTFARIVSETQLCDEADVHPDEIVIGDDEAEINANNSEEI